MDCGPEGQLGFGPGILGEADRFAFKGISAWRTGQLGSGGGGAPRGIKGCLRCVGPSYVWSPTPFLDSQSPGNWLPHSIPFRCCLNYAARSILNSKKRVTSIWTLGTCEGNFFRCIEKDISFLPLQLILHKWLLQKWRSGYTKKIVFNSQSLFDLAPEIDPIIAITVESLEIDQVNSNSNTRGYHLLRVYYMTQ